MAKRAKPQRKSGENSENRVLNAIEDLREYETFKTSILPALRKAMQSGKKPEEILEIAKSMAAARLATIACIETDSQKALVAINKLLDRTEGPVTQKVEETHKFENVTDEQLDALLETKLAKTRDATAKPTH